MSIIDQSYFKGEITVPNINKETQSETLNTFITREERVFLKMLLGDKLYYLLINNQESEPYKSLIEGDEFEATYKGVTATLKWNGLKNSDKISPIAYYVYFKYREFKNTSFSGGIEVKGEKENSRIASARHKMVEAWNNMVNLRGEVNRKYFTKEDNSTYIVYDLEPTAYNYLLANLESFPDWRFEPLNYINVFGF